MSVVSDRGLTSSPRTRNRIKTIDGGTAAIGSMTVPRKSAVEQLDRSTIAYKIAVTREHRLEAFRLIYQQYCGSGLIVPNPWRYYVTPYHASSDTSVIVGLQDHEVICTVSLVGDGKLGLPMEDIYADEVLERRRRGLTLSEVSCLAIRDPTRKTFLPLLIGMTRLMAQHARHRGIDQLLIAANPKHARFYERFMGFQRFGELKAYPKVQNRPAVASCLDFQTIDRDRPACWDAFFAAPIPASRLQAARLGRYELGLYEQLAQLTFSRQCA